MRNFRRLVLGLLLVSLAGVSWGDVSYELFYKAHDDVESQQLAQTAAGATAIAFMYYNAWSIRKGLPRAFCPPAGLVLDADIVIGLTRRWGEILQRTNDFDPSVSWSAYALGALEKAYPCTER